MSKISTKKIIRNDVFNKNIEGGIMYNYKIDNDVSDKILASCNDMIYRDKILKLISKINKIRNVISYDKSLNVESYRDKQMRVQSSLCCLKRLKVGNVSAFTKGDLDSLTDEDKVFDEKLNIIDFQLSMLKCKKTRMIQNFEIQDIINLDKQYSSVVERLAEINNDIASKNSKISDCENEYKKLFNDFLVDLKKAGTVKMSDSIVDERIIDEYNKMRIIKQFDEFLMNNMVDVAELLSMEEVMIGLGEYMDFIRFWYCGDVGTDCKSSN